MVHLLITFALGDAWWLQQLRLDLHCGRCQEMGGKVGKLGDWGEHPDEVFVNSMCGGYSSYILIELSEKLVWIAVVR